jgi:hypothetical protein
MLGLLKHHAKTCVGTFVVTFGAVVTFLWGVSEPVTHFREDILRDVFGKYWWIIYLIVPALTAFITTIIAMLISTGSSPPNKFIPKLRSSGNLRNLLELAIDQMEKATQTDYNQILLRHYDGYDSHLLSVADSISPQKQGYRVALYQGLLGNAISTGRTVNAGDVSRFKEEYIPAVPETRSELVVPIKHNGAVSGVLNSESDKVNHFNEDIQSEVEQLADAVGQLLPTFGWNSREDMSKIPWIQKWPSTMVLKSYGSDKPKND